MKFLLSFLLVADVLPDEYHPEHNRQDALKIVRSGW